jgi:hypothetical protein
MRPELPDYGAFLRWPGEGSAWMHPDDRAVVMRMIPSERVFRRERFDGIHYHFRYGDIRFRLKPCMWLPLEDEGIDIGDLVETVGLAMERELFVATVIDALFVAEEGRRVYRLARGSSVQDRLYGADELKVLTDKTKLRESGNVHPEPHWDESFRQADLAFEEATDDSHLAPDIKTDHRTD